MQHVKDLASKLKEKKGFSLNMVMGLDGFVDEILHAVDKRQDYKTYTRIPTITEYANRIAKAAGLSTNLEMVSIQTKLGGNGPILSNALISYGVDLTYAGLLGKPDIHPVFKPMAEKAKKIYSLGNPGFTDAAEFEDGKVMMGKHSTLADLTWDVFKEGIGGVEGLKTLIKESDLFGMENWTMLPHMSDIWQGLVDEVFPLLQDKEVKPLAFFDLADPEKRTKEDILRAMNLISKFETKFRTILGLNEKEVYEIAEVFDIKLEENDEKLKNAVMAVYEKMGIHCLMVHPVRSACCAINGQYYFVDGPYCQKPKLTTGAGDNLNAGFCLGMSLGLDPLSCVTLGVSTSGFYVRNAVSPTYDEVIKFAEDWADGKVSS